MPDINGILKQLQSRMEGLTDFASSPFSSGVPGGSSPFTNGGLGGVKSPFQGGMEVKSPFEGRGFSIQSPFAGKGFAVQSPFQSGFNVAQPFGGNPLAGLAGYNPYAPKAPDAATAAAGAPNYTPGVPGSPSTGMNPNVARWATQAQQTFGDYADVMLAIMTNESGGSPTAYNPAGDAWGLFQQVGLNSNDPNVQFAAAKKLLDEKLAGIQAAYAKNGLNPDARTRARDIALAWAGHFDYSTGTLNPNSRDIGPGQQTAQQLADIFLKNYDAIVSGRRAPAGGTTPGVPGNLNSIWGGTNASIMQEFGNTDYSAAHPYNYGGDFGMGTGHHGLDIGLARGSRLYVPADGVVTIAGGSGYFRDDEGGGDGAGRGELRIRLTNGDEVILGHMAQIALQVGQRVRAGDFAGLSGGADGSHLHLEWRVQAPTGTGWRVVDPRTKMKW